ncbi:MAG: hypothetical protein MJ105_00395 [Lachnospiraceae bacterium]|nr:hypothetical protein [Lachnospiraceae bacterium]
MRSSVCSWEGNEGLWENSAIHKDGDYHVALGLGTLITSITMTLFYLILYFVYSLRYQYRNRPLMVLMIILAVARIALCLLPQNDWTGESPVIWGIYRNIPFVVMGIIMVVLYFQKRNDQAFDASQNMYVYMGGCNGI